MARSTARTGDGPPLGEEAAVLAGERSQRGSAAASSGTQRPATVRGEQVHEVVGDERCRSPRSEPVSGSGTSALVRHDTARTISSAFPG